MPGYGAVSVLVIIGRGRLQRIVKGMMEILAGTSTPFSALSVLLLIGIIHHLNNKMLVLSPDFLVHNLVEASYF